MAINEPVVMVGSIISNREIAAGQYLLSCQLPIAFPEPAPGQFIMLRTNNTPAPLLRRPFSVYIFQKGISSATLEIIYRLVAEGTRQMATLSPGAPLSVMGPLGRGFTLLPEQKNIILLAGGVGLAPLAWLATCYTAFLRNQELACPGPNRRIICYLGAATSDSLVGTERMASCCNELKVCTDDGSCGYHGNVIELFRRDRDSFDPADTAIYACGPRGMLKSLADFVDGKYLFCQVSLEERMACGLGACLGCAVAMRGGKEARIYGRICKDGPVFNIQDVDWNL